MIGESVTTGEMQVQVRAELKCESAWVRLMKSTAFKTVQYTASSSARNREGGRVESRG